MKGEMRFRFWLEISMATITGILFVVTLIWRNWIEIVFNDGSSDVVKINTLKKIEKESDKVTESLTHSNSLIDTFLSQYQNSDGTYTLPKIVLEKLVFNAFQEVNK
jgi:hypothetical protein